MAEDNRTHKEKALGNHSEVMLYLIPVVEQMVEIGKTKKMTLDRNVPLAQFDIILQHSLLRAATIGNKSRPVEIDFIKYCSDKGDITKFISNELNQPITWDDINGYTPEKINEILDKVEDKVIKFKDQLIKIFIIVNTMYSQLVSVARMLECVDNIFDAMLVLGNRPQEQFNDKNNIIIYSMFKTLLGLK